MNTKSVKQCKHPKKMKPSKTSVKPEVFVLPPDILKQLGISIGLGNINENQETITTPPNIVPNADVSNYDNITDITTSDNSRNISESSFLETANLMKKSVFLSPTFVPTVSNVIPGEIQLICKNNIDSSVVAETELVDAQNSGLEPVGSIEVLGVLPEVDNIEKDTLIKDQVKLSGDFTVNGVFTPVSNVEQDEDSYEDAGSYDNVEMQIESTISSQHGTIQESKFDDLHSENSNNNIITAENPNALVHIFDKKTSSDIIQKNNPKINIISEETIPISKLKELQLHSTNTLTPVPVNTIIAPKKVNEKHIPVHTSEKHPVVIMSHTEVQYTEPNEIHSETNHTNNILQVDKNPNLAPLETTSNLDPAINITEGNTLDNVDICMEIDQINGFEHSIREVEINPKTSYSANLKDENFNGVNTYTINEGQLETNQQKDKKSKSMGDVTSDSYHASDLNEYKLVNNTEISIHDQISDENQCSYTKDTIENSDANKEKFNLESQNINKQNPENHKSKHVDNHFVISKTTVNNDKDNNERSLDELKNFPINDEEEKPLLNEELVKSFNVTDQNACNITKADKVKEIAAYLKKLSHIYTDKNKIKAQLANDTNKKETIQSNTNMIKSKLCIQGVEKPGGKSVLLEPHGESKVIKTYAKCNKQKPFKKSTKTLNSIEPFVAVEAPDHELNTVEITQTCITQDFCICNDFGRMAYYDYDDVYEHIHFANNTTNSDLDLIFSIYSDEVGLVNNKFEIVEEQKTEEIVETLNFCWNVFNSEPLDTKQIQHKIALDMEDNSCFDKSVGVSEYNDDTQDKNNSTASETHDQVDAAMTIEKTHDVLETVDHMARTTNTDGITINNDENFLIAKDSFSTVNRNNKKENDRNDNTMVSELMPTSASEIQTEPDDVSEEVPEISKFDKKNNDAFNIKENALNESQNKETKNKSVNMPKKKEKQVNQDSPKPKENKGKKRRLSDKSLSATPQKKDEPSSKKNIKCALCNDLFSEEEWDHHVANKHQHIAWKAGQSIDLDKPELLAKLNKNLKKVGFLQCPLCATEKKKLKKYIIHVRKCIEEKATTEPRDKSTRRHRTEVVEDITCGVCQQSVQESNWLEHIGKEHNYLSWKEGQEEAWDLEDETLVAQHLLNIIRGNGNLVCYKCGLNRRRVKLYLAHIKTCDGSGVNVDDSINVDANTSYVETEPVEAKIVKCGVCKEEMPTMKWMEHIAKEHNYLAWQDDEAPLDLEDEEAVWKHLLQIIRDYGCLICHKCGLNRRRVKLYLSHIKTCDGTGFSLEDSFASDFNASNVEALESNVDKDVECGVCNQTMPAANWVDHICKTHHYMAWKVGETPLDLDNEEAIWNHLQQYIRTSDGLICYKCGLQRKRVKLYLSHIKTCDGSESQGDISGTGLDNTNNTWFEVPIETEEKKFVECGVCRETISIPQWMDHIGQKHNYLAWPAEAPPLDLEDESALRVHLLNISKQIGGLTCNTCGKNIKYSKTYLGHVKECTGVPVVPEDSTSNYPTSNIHSIVNNKKIKSEPVVCGVCQAKVEGSDWLNHIHKAHQYIAWVEGQQPIDVNDHAMVQRHLNDVSKLMGGLQCLKCGVRRKYVKTFQQHVETCEGNMGASELSTAMMSKDELECAVCSVKVVPKDWRDHAMKEHYNVAWVVGDIPIDLNSPYLVEGYIKEYLRRFNKLVCKICGASRVSCVGFYAHILLCGKSEEETENYKDTCEICNNKYLRIYKSQHMTAHREAEYAAERKLLIAKEKELKKYEDDPVEVIVSGRRKAAEKAKTVIEKYKDTLHEGVHHCPKCGFSTEIEGELSKHVCVDNQWGEVNDSDESVKMEHSSDEDSDDTDIDSNISEEEREACEQESKNKRYSDTCSSKAVRLPYQVKNTNAYMKRSAEEFAQKFLTDEDLFPQWHSCEYEAVPDNELVKYMPPIEESCNLKIGDDHDWRTFKRFESDRDKDTLTMFVGASIQCVSWVPAGQPQLLALVSHRHADVPRYAWDSRHSEPGLVQIWDCGNFVQYTPKFALGLAHDYGTFWAMDWCPSGARDVIDFVPEENQMHRLGLFAAACSNGSAYIFSVPYPSSITENDKLFYKIKPVAELRLTMGRDRAHYQATSIKWSAQKGHSQVVVGYSDGCLAFYDINSDSPLLRSTENNMTVFYPYHDERVQNACIEDVDVFPGAGGRGGAVAAGGAGGAGAGALQSHVACARVLFPPHWPAALLAGDDCLVNQSINELEWFGSGRRLGGVRCAAGCAWCGRVAAAALPLLRLLRLHPCYTEVHKQVISTIQMVTLGNKRKRQNDELGMIVEPITYTDVVKKYGIEFKPVVARDRATQQRLTALPRDTYPERFPLSDVTSMKFCPTYQHHDRLAIALHAGFIFITNV